MDNLPKRSTCEVILDSCFFYVFSCLMNKKTHIGIYVVVFIFFGLFSTIQSAVITASLTGGNWNVGSTWTGGVAPAAGDDAIIPAGITVNLTTNQSITNCTVQGTGILNLNTNTRTLTVTGNFIMNGTSAINGNVATRVITVAGNYSVIAGANVIVQDVGLRVTGTALIAGTLTFNTGATAFKSFGNLTITGTFNNTTSSAPFTIVGNMTNNGTFNSGAGRVTFTGAASINNTISGTAVLTSFSGGITINKGATADVLEVTCPIALTPTAASNELVPTRGFFKISSASTFTPFFANKNAGSPYDVAAAAGLWLNHASAVLLSRTAGGNASAWSIEGVLRVTSGTINIGSATDDWLAPRAGSTIEIQGGVVNVSGRVSQVGAIWTWLQSGGLLKVPTVATASSARPPFNMELTTQVLTMSGGTINIQRAGGTATGDNSGFYCKSTAAATGMTGGMIQIGNASTPAGNVIEIESTPAVYNVGVNSANVTARISNNNLTVRNNLSITDGIFDMNALDMTVGGNWSNTSSIADPYLQGVRTVTFNGSATAQTISNTGNLNGTTFYRVVINNTFASSPQIALSANMVVTNTLVMTQGVTDMGGNTFTLGASAAAPGTLICTPANNNFMANGTFRRYFATATVANASSTGLFPMGNLTNADYYASFYVTCPTTAPTTGGVVSVSYNDPNTVSTVSFADGTQTIVKRHDEVWTVSSSALAGGSYNLRADRTFTAPAVGATTDLRLTLIGSVVGSSVAPGGTVLIPQVNRTGLTVGNLTNNFYIGSIDAVNSPLPIELLTFTVIPINKKEVLVDWSTATEKNNDYFEIEKTIDGINYEFVGKQNGNGNSNTKNSYSLIDHQPKKGLSYYRLKQVDLNGDLSYSPLAAVNLGAADEISYSLYPNPNKGEFTIVGNVEGGELSIYNVVGQKVEYRINSKTNSSITIDCFGLSSGIYFINMKLGSETKTQKFIIE